MIRFTAEDLERANWDWQCSCGPATLAAICELTLDEVRPHFNPAFPGYATPSRMFQALRNAGARWSSIVVPSGSQATWPARGIARIQWHGPWTASGANQRWAHAHTHWVGASRTQPTGGEDRDSVRIWDCNELSDGDGWSSLSWWSTRIVPRLIREIPRAAGGWHVTHAIEVER